MLASIVTLSDEKVVGQFVDTTSHYLAEKLDTLGFKIEELLSISTQEDSIRLCLNSYLNKMDLVIITSGFGSLKDDVLERVLDAFCGDVSLVDLDVDQMEIIAEDAGLPVKKKEQALLSSKGQRLTNAEGSSLGLLLQKEQTVYVILSVDSFYIKSVFEDHLQPYLIRHFKNEYHFQQTIVFTGIDERDLKAYLSAWEAKLEGISLVYLSRLDEIRLKLTCIGQKKEIAEEKIKNGIKAMPVKVLPFIISFEKEDILDIIIKNLIFSGKSISFAESCTGGKFAVMFSERPGASAYFKGGVVTYATESKINILGVNRANIEKHSVVSAEVAKEMAVLAREKFRSDYAIASTGNAGPSKGDSDVEVGTVFLALATKDDVYVEKFNFGQPREKVIASALAGGLKLIYNQILKK